MNVHEEFMSLYSLSFIQASSIALVIHDTIVRLNLTMTKVRGQCYDGVSNTSGLRNGVATQIQEDEPRATYTQCYYHSLNLAASDTILHVQGDESSFGDEGSPVLQD